MDQLTDDPTADRAAEYWLADRWFSSWQGDDMAETQMEIIANQASQGGRLSWGRVDMVVLQFGGAVVRAE